MAGGNKRRLSRGGSAGPLLGKTYDSEEDSDADLMDEEDEEDEPVQRGRSVSGSASGRRRSSFGGARFENAEEQERVVGMYTNIIKLSSENKINDKNSWNLDLIDNMGKLIKNDSREHRGVNFQKASCTLDASIKIYSHRVDDTYSTSHRVLESFSRNKLDEGEEEENEEDEDGAAKPKKGSRVGSRKRSGAANTIEKNVDNINAKEIENEAKVDPIFQTMSKLFDKGGVHGMLLYNLRCTQNAPGMALCTEGLPNPLANPLAGATAADASAAGAAAAAVAPLLDSEHLTLEQARAHIMGDAPPASASATAQEEKEGGAAAESVTPFDEKESVDAEGGADAMEVAAPQAQAQAQAQEPSSEPEPAEERLADLVDITAWTAEIGLCATDLAGLSVCPQFDTWRDVCNVRPSEAGLLDPLDFATAGATATASTTDADADAMDEEGKEEAPASASASSAVLMAARAKSAMKAGFYDHSCLPFVAWAASLREAARRRREMALLSATSSSSAMHSVHTQDGCASTSTSTSSSGANVNGGTQCSPEEQEPGMLGFAPQTQEEADDYQAQAQAQEGVNMDAVPGEGDDDGHDDGDMGGPFLDLEADLEADDCDEDGNYIASDRRASMLPPPLTLAAADDTARLSSSSSSGDPAAAAAGGGAGGAGGRLSLSPVKPQSKIQWAAVNGEMQVSEDQVADNLHEEAAQVEGMIDGLAAHAGAVASGGAAATAAEYAFFDVETVSKNNHWAGARHWRWGSARATRSSATPAAAAAAGGGAGGAEGQQDGCADDEDEDAGIAAGAAAGAGGGGGKKGAKKAAATKRAGKTGTLDFSLCLDRTQWDAEASFAAPKRADTTCMTGAALDKAAEEAAEGALFLPKDDKVEARDLCRLLSVRKVVVPPVMLRDLVIPAQQGQGQGGKRGRFARLPAGSGRVGQAAQPDDVVWALSEQSAGDDDAADAGDDNNEAPHTAAPHDHDDDDGPADDDEEDIDYDDDRFFAPGGTADAPEAAAVKATIRDSLASSPDGDAAAAAAADAKKRSVFDFDESRLIQLERKVEKIDIGYSVIPKKVNVKQLKVDMWDQVATLAGVERGGGAGKNKNKKARRDGEHDENDDNEGEEEDDENEEPPPQDFHATQSSKQLAKTSDTAMSFQKLVNTVASAQKQKEVTLSFYFICLLHLANEKTLRITDDKENLDELVVSSDAAAS